jgi:hypothetical protein
VSRTAYRRGKIPAYGTRASVCACVACSPWIYLLVWNSFAILGSRLSPKRRRARCTCPWLSPPPPCQPTGPLSFSRWSTPMMTVCIPLHVTLAIPPSFLPFDFKFRLCPRLCHWQVQPRVGVPLSPARLRPKRLPPVTTAPTAAPPLHRAARTATPAPPPPVTLLQWRLTRRRRCLPSCLLISTWNRLLRPIPLRTWTQ